MADQLEARQDRRRLRWLIGSIAALLVALTLAAGLLLRSQPFVRIGRFGIVSPWTPVNWRLQVAAIRYRGKARRNAQVFVLSGAPPSAQTATGNQRATPNTTALALVSWGGFHLVEF